MTSHLLCAAACLLFVSLVSVSAAPDGIIFGGGPTRPPVTIPITAGPVRCRDPQNQLGTCVPFSQCPELRKYATERNVAYLKASVCHRQGNTILLCCPDSPPPTEKPTVAPSNTAFKSHPDCGLTDFGPPGRIVGGEPVRALGDLPWMAALGYTDVKPEFQCGGAVIAPQWILTAAHCVTDNGPHSARVGDLDLLSSKEDDFLNPPQDVDVERIFRHPEYKRLRTRALMNDIALIKVKQPIKFSDVVRPICIPEAQDSAITDREVMIAGWGLTEFAGEVAPTMMYANINMSLPGYCQTAYSRSGVAIDENMHVCASGNDLKNLPPGCTVADLVDKLNCQGGRDACSGDSGGPLMSHRRLPDGGKYQFRAEAVGIVSFAMGCGDPRHPGVYTRVWTYVDWIGQTIRDNST